ncbi:gas vesicle protein [Arthrospira sp. PCC 9108]|nr:gas vesicle protein [Arthrospira sp. PCC 9108]
MELLDRLLNTGIVVEGSVDLGLAQINLIHAKLRLVLTSKPLL